MSGLYNLVTAQSHRQTHSFIEGLKEMQLKGEERETSNLVQGKREQIL